MPTAVSWETSRRRFRKARLKSECCELVDSSSWLLLTTASKRLHSISLVFFQGNRRTRLPRSSSARSKLTRLLWRLSATRFLLRSRSWRRSTVDLNLKSLDYGMNVVKTPCLPYLWQFWTPVFPFTNAVHFWVDSKANFIISLALNKVSKHLISLQWVSNRWSCHV
jgi:hypothetical protein